METLVRLHFQTCIDTYFCTIVRLSDSLDFVQIQIISAQNCVILWRTESVVPGLTGRFFCFLPQANHPARPLTRPDSSSRGSHRNSLQWLRSLIPYVGSIALSFSHWLGTVLPSSIRYPFLSISLQFPIVMRNLHKFWTACLSLTQSVQRTCKALSNAAYLIVRGKHLVVNLTRVFVPWRAEQWKCNTIFSNRRGVDIRNRDCIHSRPESFSCFGLLFFAVRGSIGRES